MRSSSPLLLFFTLDAFLCTRGMWGLFGVFFLLARLLGFSSVRHPGTVCFW